MQEKLTRREALKLGTGAALSMAGPLLAAQNKSSPPAPTLPRAMKTGSEELCWLSAVQMVEAIRKKEVSARELMEAHLKQIHQVNERVNAFATLVPEDELLAQASAAD